MKSLAEVLVRRHLDRRPVSIRNVSIKYTAALSSTTVLIRQLVNQL